MQEGQFTLFKNTKGANNAPYYIGEGMYKGEKLRLAFWVKEGKNGKYLSGKISVPLESKPQEDAQDNDGLPF